MTTTGGFKFYLNGKESTEQEVRDCKETMSVSVVGVNCFYSFSPKIERVNLELLREKLLQENNNPINLADIADLITAKTENKFFKVIDKIKIAEKEIKTEENKDVVEVDKDSVFSFFTPKLEDKLKLADSFKAEALQKIGSTGAKSKVIASWYTSPQEKEKIKETVFLEFKKLVLETKGFDPSEGSWFYDTPIKLRWL
jgi:hypothetical protein